MVDDVVHQKHIREYTDLFFKASLLTFVSVALVMFPLTHGCSEELSGAIS